MFLVTNYKVSSDLNQYVHVEFQEKNEIRIGDFVIHQWSKNSWFYTKDEYFYKNDDASEAFIFQGYAWYQDVKLSAQRFYELLKSKSFDVKSLKNKPNFMEFLMFIPSYVANITMKWSIFLDSGQK